MYFEAQHVEFADRQDAGRKLAERLMAYREQQPVVIGLPRGGVVVAYEVAMALGAPLDILVVRKLGAPDQPELGIGAVVDADDPQVMLYDELVRRLGVSREHIDAEVEQQIEEIRRREHEYRADRPPTSIEGRTVVLVDDGIATGSTVRAAIWALRARHPRHIVLATPVVAPETLSILEHEADTVIALAAPSWFRAVGQFYTNFAQTTDEEVVSLLSRAGSPTA
jgi:putative phosphoribosyl transferase